MKVGDKGWRRKSGELDPNFEICDMIYIVNDLLTRQSATASQFVNSIVNQGSISEIYQ